MKFDYFYDEQSESYSFYRIPKLLFTDEMFETLTVEARVLYGLLLDRISLSRQHGWIDEMGRVYVFYTIEQIKAALRCGNTKACRLLKELDSFGLIERKKQGLCRPSIIYVKDFLRFPKREVRDSQNENPGVIRTGKQEISEWESINTDNNDTDIIKTYPILSDEDKREQYRSYLYEHLEMDIMYERYPYDKELLDSVMDLMLDVLCSKRKTIRIAGDDKPANVVKSQFMKVDHMHIEYVMECMQTNASRVRNIKQYMLAAIYNAPYTMQSYYMAKANADVAEAKTS